MLPDHHEDDLSAASGALKIEKACLGMSRQPPKLVVAMSSDRGPIARVAVLVERLALTDTAHHLNG